MPIGGTAFSGANQAPRLTTNYLNQAGRTGDPAPGVNVSTAQISGSIVQPYYGFAGGKWTLDGPFASQYADPSVGPLYGGVFQYVQLDTASATPVRGQVLFWKNEATYTVTTNGTTAAPPKVAGIALNATTPGNWDFMQISGQASVKATGTAIAIGAMVNTVPSATSYCALATVMDNTYLGMTMAAIGANGVGPVQLNLGAGYAF